jgi:hypothetical protein
LRCEVSEEKEGRFGSAGITSGEASAKSQKIYARASLGIALSSMRSMRSKRKSTSIATHLDRIIQRDADSSGVADSPFFPVTKDSSRAGLGDWVRQL